MSINKRHHPRIISFMEEAGEKIISGSRQDIDIFRLLGETYGEEITNQVLRYFDYATMLNAIEDALETYNIGSDEDEENEEES